MPLAIQTSEKQTIASLIEMDIRRLNLVRLKKVRNYMDKLIAEQHKK